MNKVPYFPFYAADYIVDTRTWLIEEKGIYTDLLAYEWVNGNIPKDFKSLSQIVCISERKLKRFWQPRLSEKFKDDDKGGMINPRMELERQKLIAYRLKRSIAGTKGMKERYKKK